MGTYKKIVLAGIISVTLFAITSIYSWPERDYSISTNNYIEENQTKTEKTVLVSGKPIGIYVKSKGIMVIGTSEISDDEGNIFKPSQDALMRGDYILGVNGVEIKDKATLMDMVSASNGESVTLDVLRDKEQIKVTINPIKTYNGKYMMGAWVKDDIAGIGTLTFIDENKFVALGHSINDNDTGELFELSDGGIYETKLVNIVKASKGSPGRIEGVIDYSKESLIGRINENDAYGISGKIVGAQVDEQEGIRMPVADKNEIKTGKAYIYSCINGKGQFYEINITDINYNSYSDGKNMKIKVTDLNLLNETNGIIQGMSGSPIIQDGKLVGAVTHVFVNDPTRGYGIFIENMLEH